MNSMKYNLQKLIELDKDWTQITNPAVNHSNHYTRKFSILVWDYKFVNFI